MRKILASAAVLAAGLTGCKSKDARPAVPEDGAVWVNVNVNTYIRPSNGTATTTGESRSFSAPASAFPPPPPPPIPKPPCEPVAGADCKDGTCKIPLVAKSGTDFLPYVYVGVLIGLVLGFTILGRKRIARARRRYMRVAGSAVTAVLACFMLAGCSSIRPAMYKDVEDLRDDQVQSAKAEHDTFRDHLVANPGDIEGAVGKAFGANLKSQMDLREKRQKENTPTIPDFPYLPVGGGAASIVAIAWAMIRRAIKKYDEEPMVAPDGRRITEEQVVAGALKAHEIKQG